jgi:hypothetical protein
MRPFASFDPAHFIEFCRAVHCYDDNQHSKWAQHLVHIDIRSTDNVTYYQIMNRRDDVALQQ